MFLWYVAPASRDGYDAHDGSAAESGPALPECPCPALS
jgi:hypothetical protein